MDGRNNKNQHNDDKIEIGQSLTLRKYGGQDSWEKRHSKICKLYEEGTGT